MKIARLTPFSTTPAYEAPLTEVEKSVESFKAETKGLGAGAVALGAQALQAVVPDVVEPGFLQRGKEWGLSTAGEQLDSVQAPKYQPRVARVEDITTAGDAVDWAKYQGTKGLLNVASMALGAGAGGLLGGTLAKGAVSAGVKQYAKGQIGQRLGAELITEAGKKQAKAEIAKSVTKGAARGAIAGGTAFSFGMEGGDSFVSNVREGVTPEDALAPALAVGAVAGMLDIVPGIMAAKYAGRTIKDAMRGVRGEILADATLAKKAVHIAKTAAKAGAEGIAAEGVTEGLQELVQIAGERWAKNEGFWDALSEEQRSQVLNAAAAGGLVGGVIGGAGGAARGGAETLMPQATEAPLGQQPPEQQPPAQQVPPPPSAQPPAAAPAFELTPPVAPTEVAPQLELQPQQPEEQMELGLPLPEEQVPAGQLALDFEAPPPFALTEPVPPTEPAASEPEQPREANPDQLELDLQQRPEFELTMPEAPLEEPALEPAAPRVADPRQMELDFDKFELTSPAEADLPPGVIEEPAAVEVSPDQLALDFDAKPETEVFAEAGWEPSGTTGGAWKKGPAGIIKQDDGYGIYSSFEGESYQKAATPAEATALAEAMMQGPKKLKKELMEDSGFVSDQTGYAWLKEDQVVSAQDGKFLVNKPGETQKEFSNISDTLNSVKFGEPEAFGWQPAEQTETNKKSWTQGKVEIEFDPIDDLFTAKVDGNILGASQTFEGAQKTTLYSEFAQEAMGWTSDPAEGYVHDSGIKVEASPAGWVTKMPDGTQAEPQPSALNAVKQAMQAAAKMPQDNGWYIKDTPADTIYQQGKWMIASNKAAPDKFVLFTDKGVGPETQAEFGSLEAAQQAKGLKKQGEGYWEHGDNAIVQKPDGQFVAYKHDDPLANVVVSTLDDAVMTEVGGNFPDSKAEGWNKIGAVAYGKGEYALQVEPEFSGYTLGATNLQPLTFEKPEQAKMAVGIKEKLTSGWTLDGFTITPLNIGSTVYDVSGPGVPTTTYNSLGEAIVGVKKDMPLEGWEETEPASGVFKKGAFKIDTNAQSGVTLSKNGVTITNKLESMETAQLGAEMMPIANGFSLKGYDIIAEPDGWKVSAPTVPGKKLDSFDNAIEFVVENPLGISPTAPAPVATTDWTESSDGAFSKGNLAVSPTATGNFKLTSGAEILGVFSSAEVAKKAEGLKVVSYDPAGQPKHWALNGAEIVLDGSDTYKVNTGTAQIETTSLEAAVEYVSSISTPGTQTTGPVVQPAAATSASWAPTKLPPGYVNNHSSVKAPSGKSLGYWGQDEAVEVAWINEWIRNLKAPSATKIDLYNAMPQTSGELAQYKTSHPHMFRKESVEEAQTVGEAQDILQRIIHDQVRYETDELLDQMELFKNKYGEAALESALNFTPQTVVEKPLLSGWLQGIRSEEDMLNENPHETTWAGYPTRSGHNETASRYGVVIINPKTNKVLIRRVANDFEGLTWDFARGGAERFPAGSNPPTRTIQTDDPAKIMEHPLLAAKREAKEEFGVDAKIIGQLAEGFYSGSSNMASLYYVAVQQGDQTAFEWETTETKWVGFEEARELLGEISSLPADPQMKRGGPGDPRARKRADRIIRTLENVFDPNRQKSGMSYKGNAKALQKFYAGKFFSDFGSLAQKMQGKQFEDLTFLQEIEVASALWAEVMYPGFTSGLKEVMAREEIKRRKIAAKEWIGKHADSALGVTDVKKGTSNVASFKAKPGATMNPQVITLWHGSNNKEGLVGDTIDPSYFSTAVGGEDTKHGMFLTTTEAKAKAFASSRTYNLLVAFKNLKVETWGTTQNYKSYSSSQMSQRIIQAKADGYDGVLFPYVSDNAQGHQFVVWNGEQVVATGQENVGFTGKTLYQTQSQGGQPFSVEEATAVLGQEFGTGIEQMLADGKLTLETKNVPEGVAGEYLIDEDRIVLYPENIGSVGELVGALLHEGRHARLDVILGDSVKKYHMDLVEQAEREGVAREAFTQTAVAGVKRFGLDIGQGLRRDVLRVREELSQIDPAFLVQEDLANYVQLAYQAGSRRGVFGQIIEAVKAWWAQTALGQLLKQYGIGPKLSEGMAVLLARQAVRTAGQDLSVKAGSELKNFYAFAAHVTKKDYPKPDLKYVLAGQGEGYISFGWGYYLLEGFVTAMYYKKTIGAKVEQGYHIPELAVTKMLEWDKPLEQQPEFFKAVVRNPKDGHLLLRMALKAREIATPYPSGPKLDQRGTGGAFYDALIKYFVDTEFNGNGHGQTFDAELNKVVRNKNLARRLASRYLKSVGLEGVHFLDAGSRRVKITKTGTNAYTLRVRSGTPAAKDITGLTRDELEQYTSAEHAAKAQALPIGEQEEFSGLGHYNWVLWNQDTLDSMSKIYLNKSKLGQAPPLGGYDLNTVGGSVKESQFLDEYVIHPYTGEYQFTDVAEQAAKQKYGYYYSAPEGVQTYTREQFAKETRALGKNWLRRAEALGVLKVNETSPEGSPSGVFDPATGVMTVNLDRIPVGETAVGVLLHEGTHQNLETMLGQSFGTWAGEVRELANSGNAIARRATLKALKEVASRFGVEHELAMLEGEALQQEVMRVNGLLGEMPGAVQHLMQEQLAYYVQYAAQEPSGLFRRIINALKAWFASTGLGQRLKEMGLGPELSDGLMVELARRAAMQGMEFSSQVAHLRADGRVTEWARTNESMGPLQPANAGLVESRPEALYSMWDIVKDPGQLIFAPLGNNVNNLSRAERFTKYAIDRFDLMRQHQRREWFAVQNGKKLMALGRDKEQALQTLLSPQSGLPRDAKFQFLPTDRPLPEGQMVHEAFEAAPKRKADRRGQMYEKYLDPIFKAASRFGMTVEDLDALAYARHAGEANERLRRVTAKGWLGDLLKALPEAEAKRVKKEREAAKLATKQDMKERQKRYLGLILANSHLAPPDFQADWNEFYTKPSGMTEAEATQILSEYDQGQISQIFDMFDEMNRSVVAQLVAGGVLSQDQAAKWTGAYGHYATLKRLPHENEGTSYGSGGMSVGKAARLRYGSPDPATNVFTNTVESMERAMDLVENNRVMGTLKNFLEANPDEEFLRIVRKDTVHYLDEEGFVVEGATRSKSLHDAVGFEKGKMFIIQAANNEKARMIVGALNNMEAVRLGPVMKVFMGMTKWMAAMSTSWSPEFFFVNLQRDFLESMFNVQDQRDSAQVWKQMVKEYPQSAKALHKVFRARSKGEAVDQNDPWVKWVRAFESNGGPTGWLDVFENTQEHRKKLETRMKELSDGMNPHKALRGVLDWIEDYNGIAENVTRLALFKAMVGDLDNPRVPIERAISLAKNLAVNFNRRGDVGTVAGALFMFANAGIQGSVRIITAMGRSTTVRKMVVATVVFSALVDQLNRAMDDDDEYDKIPEHIKERNLVFMNPFGGSAVLVPAPWGYNFFWRLGQLVSEGFEHSQGRMPDWSASGAGADVVSTFWNAFMPVHGATFAQAITPSALRPVTQIAENKDAFGQALKPEPFPGQAIPQTEQYWSNASEISKSLTKLLGSATGGDDVTSGVIDWSPAWIDRIVGELTGSLGRQLMTVADLPAKTLEGDLEVRDVPVVRKFVAFPSEAQETAKYHDRVAQVLDVERRLKAYAEGPRADQEKARELRQDPLRRMAPMVKDVERQLKSLRVRLKAAQSRGDKEGEERVKEKMELVRRRFNERWLAQLH